MVQLPATRTRKGCKNLLGGWYMPQYAHTKLHEVAANSKSLAVMNRGGPFAFGTTLAHYRSMYAAASTVPYAVAHHQM